MTGNIERVQVLRPRANCCRLSVPIQELLGLRTSIWRNWVRCATCWVKDSRIATKFDPVAVTDPLLRGGGTGEGGCGK